MPFERVGAQLERAVSVFDLTHLPSKPKASEATERALVSAELRPEDAGAGLGVVLDGAGDARATRSSWT